MNVADRFVEILIEEGITDIFGIPGEQIMPLYKAMSESSINHRPISKHLSVVFFSFELKNRFLKIPILTLYSLISIPNSYKL